MRCLLLLILFSFLEIASISGQSLDLIQLGPFNNSNSIKSFKVSTQQEHVYVHSGNSLFVSKDFGKSWNIVHFPGEEIYFYDIAHDNSLHILTNSKYHLSLDNGRTFSSEDYNFRNPRDGDYLVAISKDFVAISAYYPSGYLYVPPNQRISINQGKTWHTTGCHFYDGMCLDDIDYPIIEDKIIYNHYYFQIPYNLNPKKFHLIYPLEQFNPDLPDNILIIDKELVHFNSDRNNLNNNYISYVTYDFGEIYEQLPAGPPGELLRGRQRGSTYLFHQYHQKLYYRSQPNTCLP